MKMPNLGNFVEIQEVNSPAVAMPLKDSNFSDNEQPRNPENHRKSWNFGCRKKRPPPHFSRKTFFCIRRTSLNQMIMAVKTNSLLPVFIILCLVSSKLFHEASADRGRQDSIARLLQSLPRQSRSQRGEHLTR